MNQFIIGVFVVALGIGMAIKTTSFMRLFGRIEWFEQHLSGGSRVGYQMLGVIIILVGFLLLTGQFTEVAGGVFSKLFG